MHCPHCNNKSRVIDTWKFSQYIARHHECTSCRRRFPTIEIPFNRDGSLTLPAIQKVLATSCEASSAVPLVGNHEVTYAAPDLATSSEELSDEERLAMDLEDAEYLDADEEQHS